MSSKPDERLIHDHDELGDMLGQLITALKANDVAQSYATLDLFWARLAMHIRAEHLHLFPAISNAVSRSGGDEVAPSEHLNTIEELRHDHDFFMRELSQAVAMMRELLTNSKADVAEQLQDVRKKIDGVQVRLSKHNQVEEQGIYLWTRSLLNEAEQSALNALVNKELENMPPRFQGK